MSDIEQLQELIDEADRLSFNCNSASSVFAAWHEKVSCFLREKYGINSTEMKAFQAVPYVNPKGLAFCNAADREFYSINQCTGGLQQAKQLFKQYIDELKLHPDRRGSMSKTEKLQVLADEIDKLIQENVTSDSPHFITWRKKTERVLSQIYGKDSNELKDFTDTLFCPLVFSFNEDVQEYVKACADGLTRTKAVFEAYLDELNECDEIADQKEENKEEGNKIFIVHGHDGELKQGLARLLEKQGLVPVILSEQANNGKTIIEKFEGYSDVSAAVCLFTADDEGKAKKETTYRSRARQNVVFEAGYFAGKLGRNRVVILADEHVELPSDMQGIVYSNRSTWQFEVLKELKAMGFNVDFNKLV